MHKVLSRAWIATPFLIGLVFIAFLVLFAFRRGISSFFALDGPGPETGEKNAAPVLAALTRYKLDRGLYPQDLNELIYFHYLGPAWPYPAPDHSYEYEVFPGQGNAQEYMLSFRVRSTIGTRDCFFSGDARWLEADFTCWTKPRPIKP